DFEMTRFLTLEAAFPNVPTLLGLISYTDANGEAICGMLQEYMAGSKDGWSYILETAKASGGGDTTRDIEKLGVVTRQMHDALAGDAANAAGSDFAPLAAAAVDVERWAQKTKETIREA